MAVLTIQGIEIPVATFAAQDATPGDRGVTDTLDVYSSELGPQIEAFDLTTSLQDRETAIALAHLFVGGGEVWNETDYGSKGTLLENPLATSGSGKFGSKHFAPTSAPDDFVDLNNVPGMLPEDGWTVMCWYDSGGGYVHYGLSSNGLRFQTGALAPGATIPFSVTSAYMLSLDLAGDYDDVVVLPFAMPEAWVTQFDLTVAMSALPLLNAAGDLMLDDGILIAANAPAMTPRASVEGTKWAVSTTLIEWVESTSESEGFNNPTDLAGPTQYKTTLDQEAYVLEGRNITTGFLLGGDGQGGSFSHLHRVPEDGGAITWSLTTGAPIYATGQSRFQGVTVNAAGTIAYVSVRSDGSVGTSGNGDPVILEVNMSTGAIDASGELQVPTGGGNSSSLSVALDETNDRVYVDTGDTADEIKIAIASTLVDQPETLDDASITSLARVQVSPNDDYVVAMSDSERIAQWEISGIISEGQQFDGYSTDFVDCSAVDTTLDFEFARLDFHADLKQARDGSNHLIFCGGYINAVKPFIGKYDPEESVVADRVIAEVDISTFTGHSAAEIVVSIDVDKDGKIYALYLEGPTAADSGIVRLNADLTHDTTWDGSSLTLPRSIGSGGTGELACRIAVNESGTIGVTDRDGYLWTIGQT